TTEAKINLDNSKDRGLSRSFSVTTSASKAGDPNVFEVTSDITNIATYSTTMRAGSNGRYTDFSPENVFLGLNAGWQTVPDTTQINTGQRNVFIGNNAGYGNSTGYDNIFVGTNSGYSISTGPSNTAMGAYSLSSTTWGGQNTAIGYESMLNSDHGMMNTALGMWSLMNSEDGSYNTCVGMYSGYGNKTGGYNTSIGYKSYDSGFNSGGAHTYCTFLGNDADITGVSTYTNGTAVGNGAKVSANDQVRVGNVSVTSIGGYVGWTTLGKKSYSKEVNENIVGLEFIKKLRPVSYDLDVEMINKDLGIEQNTDDTDVKGSINRSKNLKRSGFFAEEVLKAAEESGYDFTGLDKPGNKDDQYGLRYSEFVVPLIKAVQEQQEIIEKLEARIEELEIKTDK
ncbi:MAG: hypothetical protein JXR69_10510, partial [Candidatus Delongbacteria bacterium]|nr:hypothetical protein [Candidatus Delongbacteria bacterium]